MGFDDFLPTSPKKSDEPSPQDPPSEPEAIEPALPSEREGNDDPAEADDDFSPDFEASIQLDPDVAPDIVLSDSETSQDDEQEDLDGKPERSGETPPSPHADVHAQAHAEPEPESSSDREDEDREDFLDAGATDVDMERMPAANATAAEQVETASELAAEITAELASEQPDEAASWIDEDFGDASGPDDADSTGADVASGEDLYDFDAPEPQAGTPDSAAAEEPAPAAAEAEPAVDLFDFDRPMDQVPESVVAARAAEAEDEAAAAKSEPPPASVAAAEPDPEPAVGEDEIVPAQKPTSPWVSSRSLQVVGAALGVMLLLNVAVLFTTWRSQSMAHSFVTEMGNQMLATTERMRAEGDRRSQSLREVAQLMAEPREQGYEILEAIDHDIQKGEYERARRSLHALIAVGDSLDSGVRDDILARASFRIGDTFRLQASAAAASEARAP